VTGSVVLVHREVNIVSLSHTSGYAKKTRVGEKKNKKNGPSILQGATRGPRGAVVPKIGIPHKPANPTDLNCPTGTTQGNTQSTGGGKRIQRKRSAYRREIAAWRQQRQGPASVLVNPRRRGGRLLKAASVWKKHRAVNGRRGGTRGVSGTSSEEAMAEALGFKDCVRGRR